MTPPQLYRPTLTRHLWRCRQYHGDGRQLHEVVLLATNASMATGRYLEDRRALAERYPRMPLGSWWVDVSLLVADWEVGERRSISQQAQRIAMGPPPFVGSRRYILVV